MENFCPVLQSKKASLRFHQARQKVFDWLDNRHQLKHSGYSRLPNKFSMKRINWVVQEKKMLKKEELRQNVS